MPAQRNDSARGPFNENRSDCVDYPRLVRLLASGQVRAVAGQIAVMAEESTAEPIRSALLSASRTISALDSAMLPPVAPLTIVPAVPGRLEGELRVPAGLIGLLGETASLLLEANRPHEAGELFAALGALAPDSAAGGLGLCAAHLHRGDVESALDAARWAVAADPLSRSVRETLADVLLLCDQSEAARRILRRGSGVRPQPARSVGHTNGRPDVGWLDPPIQAGEVGPA